MSPFLAAARRTVHRRPALRRSVRGRIVAALALGTLAAILSGCAAGATPRVAAAATRIASPAQQSAPPFKAGGVAAVSINRSAVPTAPPQSSPPWPETTISPSGQNLSPEPAERAAPLSNAVSASPALRAAATPPARPSDTPPTALPLSSAAAASADTGQRAGPVVIRKLVDALTRFGVAPNDVTIDVVYAPPALLDALGQATQFGDSLVFFVTESIHDGLLIAPSPALYLRADGEGRYEPSGTTITNDGFHHRTTRYLFALPAEVLRKLSDGEPHVLAIVVPMESGVVGSLNTLKWRLPLRLPRIEGFAS